MSEFLKFAFELISQILYYVIEWIVGIFTGLFKIFVTGVPTYAAIFDSYFSSVGIFGKIFSILLVVILIAIPLLLIGLLVRKIIVNIRLKAQADDNVSLYKEIGRLNRQIMQLMDEKSMILNLKTGAGVASQAGLYDRDEEGHSTLQPLPVEVTSINSGGSGVAVGGVAGVAAGSVAPGMADPLAEPAEGVAVGGVAADACDPRNHV